MDLYREKVHFVLYLRPDIFYEHTEFVWSYAILRHNRSNRRPTDSKIDTADQKLREVSLFCRSLYYLIIFCF